VSKNKYLVETCARAHTHANTHANITRTRTHARTHSHKYVHSVRRRKFGTESWI